ncbi:hypothetical protein KFE25_007226 [Diacronema lutheri]|uniref:HU family DNA-binding protein n=2 Tax=Diacronema lutheri TaxID=2081491 RepID=A0A8J6C203_DIALT|nr:hypothetical protein KFE25_007226 [Diacronema lutheri]
MRDVVRETRPLALLLLLAALCAPATAFVARAGSPLVRERLAFRPRCATLASDPPADASDANADAPARSTKTNAPTINKAELVSRIAERSGVTKKVAGDVLNATMDCIIDSVSEGNKVMLVGFGSFAPKQLPARNGRNPRTGEKLQIQASRIPSFSVAKTFKDRVNANKGEAEAP